MNGRIRFFLFAFAIARAPLAAQTAPAHDSLAIDSRILHEGRWINVHTPRAYDEGGRSFQVLYMPDGGMDEDFPHVVRAVDSLTAAGAIPPTIVVGIPNTERRRGLTGPTRVASDSGVAPHVGGSAALRKFIRDELIPLIDTRYRTTPRRAIIGESLAGLFVVETFLREPAMFEAYAAFDPSLWWNHGLLVDSAAALLSTVDMMAPRRLFIASSRDDIDAETSRLGGILRADAPRRLAWRFEQHPELTHATIFRSLEIPAIVYVLK
jgi:predicted alpha/beta superfamily hydrolase